MGTGKLFAYDGMTPFAEVNDMADYEAWNAWLWHRNGDRPPRISAKNPPVKPLPQRPIRPITYQSGQENVFALDDRVNHP